jgi:N-methylhydantoinase A/oxoprolinase/acetone carboxylase beta subunit
VTKLYKNVPVLDLVVDIMPDFSRSVVSQAQRLDLHNLKIELKSLGEQTLAGLLAEGISTEKIKVMRYLDMRYVGQWRSLTVACPRPLTADSLDRRDYIAGFDSRHDRGDSCRRASLVSRLSNKCRAGTVGQRLIAERISALFLRASICAF